MGATGDVEAGGEGLGAGELIGAPVVHGVGGHQERHCGAEGGGVRGWSGGGGLARLWSDSGWKWRFPRECGFKKAVW